MNPQDNSNVFEETTGHVPVKSWRSWLIGRPLATADAPHQTIGQLIGLAVFSSDALSSVAYGPQELMLILALAGVSVSAVDGCRQKFGVWSRSVVDTPTLAISLFSSASPKCFSIQ